MGTKGRADGVTLPQNATATTTTYDPTFQVTGSEGDYVHDSVADVVWVHGDSGTNNWDWVPVTGTNAGLRNPRTLFGSALKGFVWMPYGEALGAYATSGANVSSLYDWITGANLTSGTLAALNLTGGPGSTPELDLGNGVAGVQYATPSSTYSIASGSRPCLIVVGSVIDNAAGLRVLAMGYTNAGVNAIGIDGNTGDHHNAWMYYTAGSATVTQSGNVDGNDHVLRVAYNTTASRFKIDGATQTMTTPPAGWTSGETCKSAIEKIRIGNGGFGGGKFSGYLLLDSIPTVAQDYEFARWIKSQVGLTMAVEST